MKLELWLPAKPYVITQAWGIYNPAYERFGFSKHNGVDYKIGKEPLRFPQEYKITDKGYFENGAGNFITGVSTKKWEIEGIECYDRITLMHLEEPAPWEVGDIVKAGDVVGIPDNTGFSTGPHTHETHQRIDNGKFLDINEANHSYDHSKYQNGYYAGDKYAVLSKYKLIISLLKKIVDILRGRLA